MQICIKRARYANIWRQSLILCDDVPAIVVVQRVAIGSRYYKAVAMDACIGDIYEATLPREVIVGVLVGGTDIIGGLDTVVPLYAGERVVKAATDRAATMRVGHNAPIGQGGTDDKRVGIDPDEVLRVYYRVVRKAVTYACERGGVAGNRRGERFEVAPQLPRMILVTGAAAKQAQQQCADRADGSM